MEIIGARDQVVNSNQPGEILARFPLPDDSRTGAIGAQSSGGHRTRYRLAVASSENHVSLGFLLLQFLVCAALIASAGFVLSKSADRIAKATGLTGGWVGLALLGTVTSLPELASGISSVTLVVAPNLAVGNALGACVINLLFLVVIDAVQRRQPIYRDASAAHLLSAAFGIVMLGFVAMSLLLAQRAPALLHVGLYSPVLLGLYLLSLRNVFAHEHALHASAGVAATDDESIALGPEWRRFGLAAVVVLAAGSWLPSIADGLAQSLGWSRSFVGTLFMAFATTLPEMAVTLSALRLRALDMAIGNLLGSNLFNVTILAIDDLFYTAGPLLADASPVHAGTAVAAVIMSGLVVIGLVMRPQGRVLRVLSWVSVGLLATYVVNAALVFLLGN
jgi:cation:H+ antiporter